MAKSTKNQIVRQRLGRNSLSPELILKEAQRLAKANDCVPSIRDLSQVLGSSTMAIYRHFPNKDILESQLLDQVLGEVNINSTKKNWQGQLKDFAISHRNVLIENSWAIPLLYKSPSTGPNALLLGEHVYGIISRGTKSRDNVFPLFSAIIAMNYGWVSFVKNRPENFKESFTNQVRSSSDGDSADLKLSSELLREITEFGSVDHYRKSIEFLVAGFEEIDG